MTKIERELLRNTIKSLIKQDSYLWWELKRQSHDFGFATSVPRQFEYEQPIKIALQTLPAEKKAKLYLEALKNGKDRRNDIDMFIETTYLLAIIEEIGRRASIAAMKTVHW